MSQKGPGSYKLFNRTTEHKTFSRTYSRYTWGDIGYFYKPSLKFKDYSFGHLFKKCSLRYTKITEETVLVFHVTVVI